MTSKKIKISKGMFNAWGNIIGILKSENENIL